MGIIIKKEEKTKLPGHDNPLMLDIYGMTKHA